MKNKSVNPSSMPKMVMLSKSQVQELLTMKAAIKEVEYAFKLKASGKAVMPPKIYLNTPTNQGDFRAMPAYINQCAGLKWVSVYPDNHKHNMPTVMATIILCDPDTGYPLAIMDGTYITEIRTGAVGGLAVKYLARKDSSVIGIIGAGTEAETQLLAISEVLPKINEVKIFDLNKDASFRYAETMARRLNIQCSIVDTIEAATDADIVVTTTPSREPIIKKHHIKPGTHINAIGADAEGKQELETDLTVSSKIIVDDIEQAAHSGEINVPLSQGHMKIEEIYGTLGEVASNMKKGRENNEEITIFDSTGLAIQDIICAKLVYEKTQGKSVQTFQLLDN
jgi:alanine dehydrogenase